MVGQGEKFCPRLFDTPVDRIKKPYRPWMRADPRRRSHTIGSKWLRMGGATQTSSPGTVNGEKSVTENNANEIMRGEKSGIVVPSDKQDQETDMGVNPGAISAAVNRNISLVPNNREQVIQNLLTANVGDNTELLISDPKRRRMDQVIGSSEAITTDKDVIMSPQDENNQNQKNGILAAAAVQARHSS